MARPGVESLQGLVIHKRQADTATNLLMTCSENALSLTAGEVRGLSPDPAHTLLVFCP